MTHDGVYKKKHNDKSCPYLIFKNAVFVKLIMGMWSRPCKDAIFFCILKCTNRWMATWWPYTFSENQRTKLSESSEPSRTNQACLKSNVCPCFPFRLFPYSRSKILHHDMNNESTLSILNCTAVMLSFSFSWLFNY